MEGAWCLAGWAGTGLEMPGRASLPGCWDAPLLLELLKSCFSAGSGL